MLETIILTKRVRGYLVEIVNSLDKILLYANGYFVTELFKAETNEDYIKQAEAILA